MTLNISGGVVDFKAKPIMDVGAIPVNMDFKL